MRSALILGFAAIMAAVPAAARAQDTLSLKRMTQTLACPPRNLAALRRIPTGILTRAQLLERLARVRDRARAGESTAVVLRLDSAIKALDAGQLDNFGVALWIESRDNAAVYVLARAVEKAPQDFLHWSNLGAAMHRLGEDEASIPFLLHATRLTARSPLPWSNLGMAYAGLGDRGLARTYLLQAARLQPLALETHLALGRLALCDSDPRRAREAYGIARRAGFTKRGEDGGDEANEEGVIEPPAPIPVSELPAPEEYVRPPIPGLRENAERIAVENVAMQHAQRLLQEAGQLGNESVQLAGMLARQGEASFSPVGLTLQHSSDKAVAELKRTHAWYGAKADTLGQAYDAAMQEVIPADLERAQAIDERFAREVTECAGDEYCNARIEAKRCQDYRMLRDNTYTRLQKQATAEWNQLYPLLAEWDRVSGYWVEQIGDPAVRDVEDLMRRHLLTTRYGNTWLQSASIIGLATLPVCPPVPPAPSGANPSAVRARKGKGPCPLGKGLQADAIVVSVKVDCETITVKGGEGLVGELKYNYKEKVGTLYVAAGAGAALGLGPVKAGPSADVGVFVTFDRHGNFTDAGIGQSASFGLNAGPGVGTGLETRMGIASGMTGGVD